MFWKILDAPQIPGRGKVDKLHPHQVGRIFWLKMLSFLLCANRFGFFLNSLCCAAMLANVLFGATTLSMQRKYFLHHKFQYFICKPCFNQHFSYFTAFLWSQGFKIISFASKRGRDQSCD